MQKGVSSADKGGRTPRDFPNCARALAVSLLKEAEPSMLVRIRTGSFGNRKFAFP